MCVVFGVGSGLDFFWFGVVLEFVWIRVSVIVCGSDNDSIGILVLFCETCLCGDDAIDGEVD